MSCKITPKVKNSEGEQITAPLYNDIKKIVGPIKALEIFNKAISEEAKQAEGYSKLEFDEYNMPTIESLLKYTDLNDYVDNIFYSQQLSKDLFGTQNISFNDPKKIIEYFQKILEYNEANDNFNVFFVKNTSTKKYELIVTKKNKYSSNYNYQTERFLDNVVKVYLALHKAGFDDNYIANIVTFNYNINYAKQLDLGSFNPDSILDYTKKLVEGSGFSPQNIEFLLKNSMFSKSPNVDRYYNYIYNMGGNAETSDFIYDYLKENNLIDNTSITPEDVINNQEYKKLAANHILSRALSNAFSLKDAKYNQILIDRVDRLTSTMIQELKKIDISNLKPDDSIQKSDYDEPKRDLLLSFKSLLKESDNLKSESNKLKTQEGLLEKLISAENSRLNLAVRTGDKELVGKIKNRIKTMLSMYESGNLNLSFIQFLNDEIKEVKSLYEKMQSTMENGKLSNKTYIVRNVIQLCNYFTNCIEYFNTYMSKDSNYIEDLKSELQTLFSNFNIDVDFSNTNNLNQIKQLLSKIQIQNNNKENDSLNSLISLIDSYLDVVNNPILENTQLSKFTQLVNSIREEAQKHALDLTADFLEQFENKDAQTIPWGKNKGNKVNIREELKRMNNDINFYDLYLDAMADCPDNIIRLTDKAIKSAKNAARNMVLEVSRNIKKEAKLLRDAGIKDFSWMYKRNKDGKKTGTYITREDDEFNSLISNNPAKLKFYDYFMSVKNMIDKCYPNNNGTAQIIGIRKDRLERLKNSKNIKDFGTQIWEGVKDNWLDREDDDDIAGYEEMFTDIGGNEIKLLPIYYNNVHEGNADHMSEDAVTTLIAYANKGIEYHEMASLVNSIELEREVLKQREMPVMSGGKKILNIAMRKVYSENPDLIKQNEVTQKDLGRSNVYKMFDEHMDMALYGRFRKKEKNLGSLSTAKIIDQLNKKTAISALSLNLLNGISNILTGTSITRVEAICQQYFSVKDLVWADFTYNKEMPLYLSEKGNNIKESKLHLFIEQFDVMQDFDTNINETDWMKDTWFKKMVNSEFMSVIQNAGEHYMNTRIALALAHSMKLKTKYGKETTLWEMLDIEYLQEDGTYGKDDKKLGARLKLKEECYNKDGSEFKFDNSNIQKITRKMAGINQGIHGIYNKQDANLIQTYSVGRLLYMFRKWIPKAIDKRFANLKYNYDVEDWTEGYYQTAFRFLYGLIKEHNGMKLEIGIRWNQLDERQKANCKRALAETIQFFGLLLLNSVVFSWADDDKSGYSWLQNMAYYQSIRLQSELAALEPLSLLGSRDNMATEFTRMFKNPIAAMSPVSDALKLQQLFFPSTWTDTVQRGSYKGHSKAFVVFWGNKFLFPIGAMIPKNVGPENYVGYYLNN